MLWLISDHTLKYMSLTSNYLRNRISEYKKEELLDRCMVLLQDQHNNVTFPIWCLLILIKWSSQFAGTKAKLKELTDKRFWTVFDGILKLNDSHLSSFFDENKSFKAFYALYNQQFYLQSNSSVEDFAVQLKLYTTVKRSFDIEALFYEKSGITIQNFIKICHFMSLIMRRKDVYQEYFYKNRVDESFVFLLDNFTSKSVGRAFISTLTKNIRLHERTIFSEKNEIRLLHLQPLGISVFSQHPFIYYKCESRVGNSKRSVAGKFVECYNYNSLPSTTMFAATMLRIQPCIIND